MGKDKPKLYERLPNGRYKEWKEPERPKYDNALYRRVGKRYEPVQMILEAMSWQEGVFVVTKNHSALQPDSWTSAEYLQEIFKLYKAGDIENVSIAKLGGMQKLANHLSRHWNEIEGANTYERAASVVAILMNYNEEKQREQKVSYTTLAETGNGGINALVTKEITNGCDDEQKSFDYENANIQQKDWAEIPFGAKDSELQEVSYHIPEGFHAEIDDNRVVIKKGEQSSTCSEEDETKTEQLINVVKAGASIRAELRDEYVNWLKSLKERYTWKPSDEQMEALANALSLAKSCGEESAFDLRTLYEQLKKLRKE